MLSCLIKPRLSRSIHTSLQRSAVQPFLLADIGEGITECEIVQWFVKPGSRVAEFDKICEVQSDKASVEISSRYAGNILKLHYEPHQVALVGRPLVDIETEEQALVETAVEAIKQHQSEPLKKNTAYQKSWCMPSVRRLLDLYGIEHSHLLGSGKHGMVLKSDVLKHIQQNNLTIKARVETPQVETAPPVEQVKAKSVPLTAIQKAMFKTMTKSLSIPQLGYKDEVELNAATEYRKALNKYLADHPDKYPFRKISYLPLLLKSLSLALAHYPILNAQLINEHQLQYRDAHNIGIAVDSPQGLIVPNIKHVEQKSILQIASEIHRLTELAKKNAIPLADLKGGTISLSNIGSIGGTYANPIVVSQEMAIVAIGSAKRLPFVDAETGKIVPKQILPISWSADHRVVDGATIAQFSNTWKHFIENPALLASNLH
ncbi:2-oxoacid dehydrogenases acyltransferase-domain-containing protein [Choanephora cucurbitarum]|nr:2-oxoacid dehydrogenases acyltransferase-domain-containing protein [Choanephora cucurbitarum]